MPDFLFMHQATRTGLDNRTDGRTADTPKGVCPCPSAFRLCARPFCPLFVRVLSGLVRLQELRLSTAIAHQPTVRSRGSSRDSPCEGISNLNIEPATDY